jgi:hypothetical protein
MRPTTAPKTSELLCQLIASSIQRLANWSCAPAKQKCNGNMKRRQANEPTDFHHCLCLLLGQEELCQLLLDPALRNIGAMLSARLPTTGSFAAATTCSLAGNSTRYKAFASSSNSLSSFKEAALRSKSESPCKDKVACRWPHEIKQSLPRAASSAHAFRLVSS